MKTVLEQFIEYVGKDVMSMYNYKYYLDLERKVLADTYLDGIEALQSSLINDDIYDSPKDYVDKKYSPS